MSRIGLKDYFLAISDGTNIVNSKPDPEVFLKAADMIQESPGDCLVVEDALAGIEAAHSVDKLNLDFFVRRVLGLSCFPIIRRAQPGFF